MRSTEMAEPAPNVEMSFQRLGSRQLAEPLSRSALRGLCLKLMRRQRLVTDEEMMELSPEVQRAMELD